MVVHVVGRLNDNTFLNVVGIHELEKGRGRRAIVVVEVGRWWIDEGKRGCPDVEMGIDDECGCCCWWWCWCWWLGGHEKEEGDGEGGSDEGSGG